MNKVFSSSSHPSSGSTLYHPNAGSPGWASEHTPWLEGSMVIPPTSIPKNHTDPHRRKAKAVFVALARNSDLWSMLESMKQMEDRFNHWAGYDWVFLNDEPFDDIFKQYVTQLPHEMVLHLLLSISTYFIFSSRLQVYPSLDIPEMPLRPHPSI
jgi:hypothetical protein